MKNIFVFGADDFNLAEMQALESARDYRFHRLYDYEDIRHVEEPPVEALQKGALDRLNSFQGSVDAIVGYWDFPVSTMLPLLRKPFNLPSPTFEAVLKCEHKFWSRREQRRVIPEYIPDFGVVDPFSENPLQQVDLDFPFWIKPVKAVASHLAFRVRGRAEFNHAIEVIRRKIGRFARPFNYLLQFAHLPDDIAAVDGQHCIVESVISRGRQCTLEGYVYNRDVVVYGVVDSFREGSHRSSFSRYQYPSSIPVRIQQEMIAQVVKFLGHIEFDQGPFNVEFFWDQRNDHIWLLEINTRISNSHCPLFRYVDGASHHQVMLDLALGKRPDFPARQGKYNCAAKFMWRHYEDARVKRAPTTEELDAIRRRFDGVEIRLRVHDGMRLSQLRDQDSYSYEMAVIYMAADNQKALLQKYRDLRQHMNIELAPETGVRSSQHGSKAYRYSR